MTGGGGADHARGGVSANNTGQATGEDLAARLSELARILQHEDDLDDTLQAITHAAVDTVPGARYAGIAMVEGRREVRTRAGTDDLVYAVDQAQYDTGEGPCLATLYDERTVRLPDLSAETRWPRFTARVADLGVGSMLSLQLFVEADNLGALNLYASDTDAFGDKSEQVGLMFAAHAAVAMAGALKAQQLTRAMDIRDLIGQAKGMLMERHRLTGEQAFALLVRVSQHTNTKLVDVARSLVDTGALDHHHRRTRR